MRPLLPNESALVPSIRLLHAVRRGAAYGRSLAVDSLIVMAAFVYISTAGRHEPCARGQIFSVPLSQS